MPPSDQRSQIERSLALHIDSKNVRTHSEYKSQLSAMFSCGEVPQEITFDAFEQQMQRFGFVDRKELITTFQRFVSASSPLRIRFRDFALSLLPAKTTGSPGGRWGEGRAPTSTQTVGRNTALKRKLKTRSSSAKFFGRRSTHVTNPHIIDFKDSGNCSQLPPSNRTNAANRRAATSMSNKQWRSEAQPSRQFEGGTSLLRFPTGIIDAYTNKAPPRVNSWVISSGCRSPHEWVPPPLTPAVANVKALQPKPKRITQEVTTNQDLYVTKYMLDTENAARTVSRNPGSKQKLPVHNDLPGRTQKLRNTMNQTYNLKPSNAAPTSHSPLAMMSMGFTLDGLRQRMHTIG